ncbi:MAG: aldolase/citrate lyase family protein [Pseudomonadota bacterium]
MGLKAALRDRAPLIGTFQKTPSAVVSEVLGQTGLDMVCLDAEHAPFDRGDLDACILALRAASMSSLVRIQANRPEYILNALDCGAEGVLVPHVITGEDAAALGGQAHFGTGRGYAGSTRAAAYGARAMPEHISRSADETVAIAQIEDAEALECLSDLFDAPGVDGFFIGRADLTVSLGAASPAAPEVIEAVEMICRQGQEAGTAIGMFTGQMDELAHWRALGASFFLLGSDHGFVKAGAANLLAEGSVP